MACSCIFPFIYCIGVKRIMCMESVTVHSQLPLLHAMSPCPLAVACLLAHSFYQAAYHMDRQL
ncbi:hypothetical protein BLA28_25585 [Eisenbergiella tayi]|nr:hypothetical protein BLA28_25585 [Eisenbergiella tayi]